MRLHSKIITGLALSFFALQSYAIQVDVQTSSEGVKAIGFSVNGKSYGGRCCTYSKKEMPAGTYTFGVRVGSLIGGTDVSCLTSDGKSAVTLNADSTGVLTFTNNKCTMKIVSQVRK